MHLHERRFTCDMAISTPKLSDLNLIHNGQSHVCLDNNSVLAQLEKFFINSPPAYLFYACKHHNNSYYRLVVIEIRPRATPQFLSGKRLLMSLTICPTSDKVHHASVPLQVPTLRSAPLVPLTHATEVRCAETDRRRWQILSASSKTWGRTESQVRLCEHSRRLGARAMTPEPWWLPYSHPHGEMSQHKA